MNPIRPAVISPDGRRYPTVEAAAQTEGCSVSGIRNRIWSRSTAWRYGDATDRRTGTALPLTSDEEALRPPPVRALEHAGREVAR